MIYIGFSGRTRNGCALASPALKSTPATLTAWRATPPCMRYQSRRLSPAGTNRPTMTSASASNSRPPSRTSRPAPLRRVKQRIFARAPLASRIGQYWLQLPATFGPRDLPRYGIFSTDCRRISPTASKFVIPSFRQRGSGTAAQPRLHERNVNRVISTAARSIALRPPVRR